MSEMSERLKAARENAGFESAKDAAKALGVGPTTYAAHENGQNNFKEPAARIYGKKFGVRAGWLLLGEEPMLSGEPIEASTGLGVYPRYPSNASSPIPVSFKNETIGMFGQAVGGDDGRFVLNGQRVMDVLCPPTLVGVKDAYGVFVHGSSMEPRYEEGEAVFVNPHVPVRQGNYAVVQTKGDFEGDEIGGFIKKFVSMNSRELVLAQFRRPETFPVEEVAEGQYLLRIPRAKVVAVHKVVWSGEV